MLPDCHLHKIESCLFGMNTVVSLLFTCFSSMIFDTFYSSVSLELGSKKYFYNILKTNLFSCVLSSFCSMILPFIFEIAVYSCYATLNLLLDLLVLCHDIHLALCLTFASFSLIGLVLFTWTIFCLLICLCVLPSSVRCLYVIWYIFDVPLFCDVQICGLNYVLTLYSDGN